MIIVKCEKCGKMLHQTDKCFVCGNTSGFVQMESLITIHENVSDEYKRLEELVKNRKFEEGLELSKEVLEWMPFCSEIFWLRLLAKNHCATDEELIHKGTAYEDSADYFNAVLFADETQKMVYTTVSNKIMAVKNILSKYIAEHEFSAKKNTSILRYQSDLIGKNELYRKKLFELWKEMKKVEHDIMAVEEDCVLLIAEYKEILEKASSEAMARCLEIREKRECTKDVLYKYRVCLDGLLKQTEDAKTSIDAMRKQHPFVETYRALVKKRDLINSEIDKELGMLKSYEKTVESAVLEIERIEERHQKALESIENYNFSKAYSLLGENRFKMALAEAGLK